MRLKQKMQYKVPIVTSGGCRWYFTRYIKPPNKEGETTIDITK
jgi:hypothetical protein